MKKKYLAACLLVAIIAAALTISIGANSTVGKSDMITALRYLLIPALSKSVKVEHGQYARIDYWDVNILSIEKLTEGENMGSLEIEAEFTPFIGPHNSISRDRAKLLINFEGIEIIEYKIIETYH